MGTELQFVQYLHQMRDYNDQHPTTKGLILLGYLERDFIRFYRAGKIEEGIQFAKKNLTRSRDLLNKLSSEEKQLQLSALVDVLAFEGIQNHAEIYEFVKLRNDYHRWLVKLPVTTERYQPLVVQIIRDFAAIAKPNALAYNAHLESTLDVMYYTNAHLHDQLSVKRYWPTSMRGAILSQCGGRLVKRCICRFVITSMPRKFRKLSICCWQRI